MAVIFMQFYLTHKISPFRGLLPGHVKPAAEGRRRSQAEAYGLSLAADFEMMMPSTATTLMTSALTGRIIITTL